jgi:hypothetical protein
LSRLNDEHDSSRDGDTTLRETVPWPSPGDGPVDLDVSWLVPADLCAVDVLARLQVSVARRGRRLLLHGADGGLVELLEFVGLGDIMGLCSCCPCSAVPGTRGCER